VDDDEVVAQLTPEETSEALELAEAAQNTPCILVVSGSHRADPSRTAWDKVRAFQSRMAEKYEFDETKCAITKQGAVIIYEEGGA